MASYADSMLAPGEHIILRQRQHWLAVVLDSRMGLLMWAIAVGLLVVRTALAIDGLLGDVLGWGIAISVVVGLVILGYRVLRWRTEEYLVTTRRLVNVSGVVNKRSADSSLEKINDAILEVNLLGRILGYGDLRILTAADSGIDFYRMLRDATTFKKAMLAAKHALGTDVGEDTGTRPVPAQPAAQAPAPSFAAGGEDPMRADTPEEIMTLIARLSELRDAGHLSDEELEAKRQELLERL
jgi:hypothetical protein